MFIVGITLFPTIVNVTKRGTKSILLEILEGRCLGAWREIREGWWRCDSLQQRGRNLSSNPTDKTIESLNTLSGWIHAWKQKHFL